MAADKRRPPYSIYIVGLLAIVSVAAAVILLQTSALLVVGLSAGIALAVTVLILFERPLWAMLAFILFLPVHSLVMAVLIGRVGLSPRIVQAAAGWKEALLLVTTGVVLLRALLRGRIPRLTWVDAVALIWLGQIAVYFVLGSLNPTWHPSWAARLYGARDWLLYLLPFMIGRIVWVSEPNAHKILKVVLLIGVMTSVYGILEYFFLPISFHVQLGVPRYFREVLGLSYPDYLFGLPFNYWAEVAGRSVRRSVSTYLSGQGFAVPFLLIIPVAFVWFIRRPSKKHLLLFGICLTALLLTITRMTIVVCAIQILLILLVTRRYKLLATMLGLAVVLAVAALVISPQARTFAANTILLRDTSASARPGQWVEGVQTLAEHPFGGGLGYAGQTGARFGGSGVGQEAGYFKITGDLGLPGLALFLLWFGGILLAALNLYYMSMGTWKMLGVIVFAAAIGFLLNNLTAPPDQSVFLMYVFPFLAGMTVRQYAYHKHLRRQKHQRSLDLAANRTYELPTAAAQS